MAPQADTWTVAQCADEWGIRPSTWRDYVAKGYAPQPVPGYDDRRRRRWDPNVVRAAKASRRGQSWRRTDLSAHNPPTSLS